MHRYHALKTSETYVYDSIDDLRFHKRKMIQQKHKPIKVDLKNLTVEYETKVFTIGLVKIHVIKEEN